MGPGRPTGARRSASRRIPFAAPRGRLNAGESENLAESGTAARLPGARGTRPSSRRMPPRARNGTREITCRTLRIAD